jgi:hypothetical protein
MVATGRPSTKKATAATASSSLALAERVTLPWAQMFGAGAVRLTSGGVLSLRSSSSASPRGSTTVPRSSRSASQSTNASKTAGETR